MLLNVVTPCLLAEKKIMSVREVLRYGDPLLLQRSEEVHVFDTVELHALIEDMQDTMASYDGAGLAAPQIGELKRVVIFGSNEADENPRYPDADQVPYTILINPEITVLGKDLDGMWEGCLSVPGMRGFVERPNHIKYSGYDQYGNFFEREVKGFHAVVVQHECDHLDGILYPMKLKDMSLFGYQEEIVDALTSAEQ